MSDEPEKLPGGATAVTYETRMKEMEVITSSHDPAVLRAWTDTGWKIAQTKQTGGQYRYTLIKIETPKETTYSLGVDLWRNAKRSLGNSSDIVKLSPGKDYDVWIENSTWYGAPKIDPKKFGGHSYDNGKFEKGIRDCGCGCFMLSSASGGPVDPFGACPLNPRAEPLPFETAHDKEWALEVLSSGHYDKCSWREDSGEIIGYRRLSEDMSERIHAFSVEQAIWIAEGFAREKPDWDLKRVAEAARDFMHYAENWESWQDSRTSRSVSWPPEFLHLGEAVECFYGPPVIDDSK